MLMGLPEGKEMSVRVKVVFIKLFGAIFKVCHVFDSFLEYLMNFSRSAVYTLECTKIINILFA